jgi:glycosyltransferase involved in cell wall biosynthesis
MKILHICNSISEGGVGTFLLSLLPALKEAGHSVELLALEKNNVGLAPALERQGITVHIGKYAKVRDPRNILIIRSVIKQGGYDIAHTHLFPTQYFAAICRCFCKTPVLLTTEHTCYNKRRDRKLFRPVEKFIYGRYAKIVCVSHAGKTNLDRWAAAAHKSCTIYNGINLLKFQHAQPYSKAEIGLPENSKVIIMAARFFNQKDQKTVVRAMPYVDSAVHLLFCGSGEQGIRECKQEAATLGVGDRVHFLGNRSDMERLIKSSYAAILSSFYEGMPLSLMEYMAAGVPTIATDVDGTSELVQNHGILFPVGDYKCLAKEITHLLADKNYYVEVAGKCYARSLDFSEEKMADNYLHLYQQLLCKQN